MLTATRNSAPTTPITQSSSSTLNSVQYCVEERTRTVYVTTDVPPHQWDTQSIDKIFEFASAPTPVLDNLNTISRQNSSVSDRQIYVFPHDQSSQDIYRRPKSEGYISLPATPVSNSSRASSRHHMRPRAKILFYHKHDPHYGFTNFSSHPVYYRGKRYPTSEHLFQSFKFQDHRPNLAEHIRTCSERPSVAFSEARRFQPEVRPDWKAVNVQKMDEALWYKFTQHLDLQQELLATGEAELIEDSDKDSFWGVGADRQGRNELGKALERLRSKLRESCQS